jgi:putative ABC transport system permease protein
MILEDLIRLAISEILYHKIQSILIIGCVAIGIFAIFTLNSVGTGIKNSFNEVVAKLGTDVALVLPTSSMLVGIGSYFDEQDVRDIESIPGVVDTCPIVINLEDVGGKSYWIAGASRDCYEWMQDHGVIDLEEGRFGVAAGKIVKKELDLELNEIIEIKGERFRVTGLLKTVGNEQDDSTIYIDLDDMESLYGEKKYYTVALQFSGETENLVQAVENKFKNRDVQVLTSDQLSGQISGLLDTVNLSILGVAFISLIIGAITIANTVYATIKRRTREVGMLKAVGAEDNEVMWLFLFETMFLSLIGGIVGIVSGYLSALQIAELLKDLVLFKPSADASMVVASLLIAISIGPISAIFPALYAARLSPKDALGYE